MVVCLRWVRVVCSVWDVCTPQGVRVRSVVIVVARVRDEVGGIAAGRGWVGGVL